MAENTKPTEPKPSPPENKPEPLPKDVVAAWENARFASGWLGPSKRFGTIIFSRVLSDLKTSEAVPAFEVYSWTDFMKLEPLPTPESAFGLSFMSVYIGESNIKEVAKLQNLTSLHLIGHQITDASLKVLTKLQQLTLLNLNSTQITDKGLKEVSMLRQLDWLSLENTKITDTGFKELAKLQKLTYLILRRCSQITDEGVDELNKALSKCHIHH